MSSLDMGSHEQKDTPMPEYGGYDKLALLMAEVPEYAILRRFAALSAESLLHRQAELVDLEDRYKALREANKRRPLGERGKYYNHNSYEFHHSSADDANADEHDGGHDDGEQLETLRVFQTKLKDYQEAVCLHRQFAGIRRPKPAELRSLTEWMERPSMGNIMLAGPDSSVWDLHNIDELLAIGPVKNNEAAASSSDLTIKFVSWYHRLIGRHIHAAGKAPHLTNTVLYPDEGILNFVRVFQTVLACMLPIVGIVALYLVKDMTARVGLVAGLTAFFSLTLCLITSAGTKDIFSATAAFSAVLVVFVGATD